MFMDCFSSLQNAKASLRRMSTSDFKVDVKAKASLEERQVVPAEYESKESEANGAQSSIWSDTSEDEAESEDDSASPAKISHAAPKLSNDEIARNAFVEFFGQRLEMETAPSKRRAHAIIR